ncbi:transcriptional regulator domain-containing protein [Leptospirillum ferriphilum]|uniref:DUF2285 domain-containing protein n=1 Tax=Leptospirillum ferriphilum (strain ML-04) TaxID=1048260 RepID=J9ZAC7_LEPFM|nr:DUF6499 domain-containing protein [Leptospirillum ferriphilum]AFS53111.1 hypothetical protein LFML04_0879 [Leptospirillum ferriphilum ML-04]
MRPKYPEGLEWLPDWRYADQYPDEKTKPYQWAWEFLRRNPEYWDAHKLYVRSQREKLDHEDHFRLSGYCDQFHLRFCYFPDPALNTIPEHFSVGEAWYGHRAPGENAVSIFHLDRTASHLEGSSIVTRPNRILIDLHLDLPIEPQIKDIRSLYKEARKKKKGERMDKIRPDKLGIYLRALDAMSDLNKPSLSEIALAFYPREMEGVGDMRDHPGSQKVHENLKAAQLLRDRDFWKLLALKDPSKEKPRN